MKNTSQKASIQLTHDALVIDDVVEFLRHPRAGGIDVFLGTTRQWTGERETTELEYECYEPMAVREMERLAEEAHEQWPIKRICLHHRLGVVPVSEVSVIVGVATPHRADAFAASRFLIDALKTRVPIWKRECYADGSSEWIQGALPGAPNNDVTRVDQS